MTAPMHVGLNSQRLKVMQYTKHGVRLVGFASNRDEAAAMLGSPLPAKIGPIKGEGVCYFHPLDQAFIDQWNTPIVTPQIPGRVSP